MKIIDHLKEKKNKSQFTFEILPPLKGQNLESIFEATWSEVGPTWTQKWRQVGTKLASKWHPRGHPRATYQNVEN